MIQRRNVSHSILHQPDLFRNGIQYLQEPIGGFGVWNGQFEQPAFDTVSGAGGWEVTPPPAPEDLTMVMERVTGGLAGNWCFRGGNTNANQRSGYLRQLCYMPVDESRLYNIYCAARSTNGVESFGMGCLCYTAAKVLIAQANAVAVVGLPAAWTRYASSIGPAGAVAWPAGTRYARVSAWLQYGTVAIPANSLVYIDDIGFWPSNL